jgi:SAM-dependent methyltransferase
MGRSWRIDAGAYRVGYGGVMDRNRRTTDRMQVPTQLEIRLPRGLQLPQDQEWCEVVTGSEPIRIRFHDYAQVYSVPGLYERLFQQELACDAPAVVCSLLRDALESLNRPADRLRALDLGAGNGLVGEQLAALGVTDLVGVDVMPEAADAAERDRPGLYRQYLVLNLADPQPAAARQQLVEADFDCLTAVGSLGFNDLSPRAFVAALSLLRASGVLAFSLKEEFVSGSDPTGFGSLLRRCFTEQALVPVIQRRYRHRLAVSGEPLHYVAFVAVKSGEVAQEWITNR